MAIVLPTEKIKVVDQDPKNLILFSLPKAGKTTLIAELPDCLLIDTESGSDFVNAMKVKVKTVEDILEVCREVKKAGCPYKFIAIDTVTALEDMIMPLAIRLYQESPKLYGPFNSNVKSKPL